MATIGMNPSGRSRSGREQMPTPVRRLPLEAGEISCPQRGTLAARHCFACSWFAGAKLEGTEPAIRCAFWRSAVIERPGPLGARLARAWHPEFFGPDLPEG